jgi:RpiB/LacA/LacB family sugar-phosphate isomerase
MKLAIGSDHAGFDLKEALITFLKSHGHELIDVGSHNRDPVDYPDFAIALSRPVLSGQAERGILVCGSGVGASVAANKIVGIRAGLCHDTYSAHQSVEHDDANVLVVGGRVIGFALAQEIAAAFVNAKFTREERHLRRVSKIQAIESANLGSRTEKSA